MKKHLVLFALILFSTQCAYYKIYNFSKSKEDLRKYNAIYVGWIDFGEQRWSQYGIESKKRWIESINEMNHKSVPQYFKEAFPGKTILASINKKDDPPKNCLYVKFTDVNFIYNNDTLDITMHFIDSTNGQELSNVSANIETTRGAGYGGYIFEYRINNSIRNVAYFIKEKVFK